MGLNVSPLCLKLDETMFEISQKSRNKICGIISLNCFLLAPGFHKLLLQISWEFRGPKTENMIQRICSCMNEKAFVSVRGRRSECSDRLDATERRRWLKPHHWLQPKALIKWRATGCGLRQDFTAGTEKLLQSDSRMQPQSKLQLCAVPVCSDGGLA